MLTRTNDPVNTTALVVELESEFIAVSAVPDDGETGILDSASAVEGVSSEGQPLPKMAEQVLKQHRTDEGGERGEAKMSVDAKGKAEAALESELTGAEELLSTQEGAPAKAAAPTAKATSMISAGAGKHLCYRRGLGDVRGLKLIESIHFARCDDNAICDNEGPRCYCRRGYKGDGTTCKREDTHHRRRAVFSLVIFFLRISPVVCPWPLVGGAYWTWLLP